MFQPSGRVNLQDFTNWWKYMRGADWRHPYGPDSALHGLDRHPVVHVTFGDAEACALSHGEAMNTRV